MDVKMDSSTTDSPRSVLVSSGAQNSSVQAREQVPAAALEEVQEVLLLSLHNNLLLRQPRAAAVVPQEQLAVPREEQQVAHRAEQLEDQQVEAEVKQEDLQAAHFPHVCT